jgi:endonuclease/exonuclease/phosphatase family metal-dependent hydrolase
MSIRLKTLSYNIHKGRAYFSRNRIWHLLQELVFEVQPDLIFFQEFFREPEAEKLLENLADRLWTHHSYGQNATSGDFHYGNAILSKIPITQTANINISTNTLEKRGLLYSIMSPPDCEPIHLACTHLNLTAAGRLDQFKIIHNFLYTQVPISAPLILAGDFNDWNEKLHPLIEKQLELEDVIAKFLGKNIATFPSVMPVFALDRIYGRRFKAHSGGRIINQQLRFRSDHLPIITEIELQNEKPRVV